LNLVYSRKFETSSGKVGCRKCWSWVRTAFSQTTD